MSVPVTQLSIPPLRVSELINALHPTLGITPQNILAAINGNSNFEGSFNAVLNHVLNGIRGSIYQATFICNHNQTFNVFSDSRIRRVLTPFDKMLACSLHGMETCRDFEPYPLYWIREVLEENSIRYLTTLSNIDNNRFRTQGSKLYYSMAALILYSANEFKCIVVFTNNNNSKYEIFPQSVLNDTSLRGLISQCTIRGILYQKSKSEKDYNLFYQAVINEQADIVQIPINNNNRNEIENALNKNEVEEQNADGQVNENIHRENQNRVLNENERTQVAEARQNLEERFNLHYEVAAEEGNDSSVYIEKAYLTEFSNSFVQFRYYDVITSKNTCQNIRRCQNCDMCSPRYLPNCLTCGSLIVENN